MPIFGRGHRITLVIIALMCASSIPAGAVPIELTALNAMVSPSGCTTTVCPTTFRITDVTDFFDQGAGSTLFMQPISVTRLTDTSGFPGANQGSLDLSSGNFNLNWGFDAQFNVLNGGETMWAQSKLRG
jgi:hypothetical protein